MNDKFKELANQATNYCGDNVAVNKAWMWEQKYAELIIKECAKTAACCSMTQPNIHPSMKWHEMNAAAQTVAGLTCHTVAEEIRKHFGIE